MAEIGELRLFGIGKCGTRCTGRRLALPAPVPLRDATRKWVVRQRNAFSFKNASSLNGVTTTPCSMMRCRISPFTPDETMHSAGRYRAISEITFWKLLSYPVTVTKNSRSKCPGARSPTPRASYPGRGP